MVAIAGVRSLFVLMAVPGVSAGEAAPTAASFKEEVGSGVEEGFVFRTTRTRRTTGATPACASAPFPSFAEDFYDLWSVQPRASDARIVDTHKRSVGGFTACFGQPVQGQPLPMHAMGTVAHIPWVGTGECTPLKSHPARAHGRRIQLRSRSQWPSGGIRWRFRYFGHGGAVPRQGPGPCSACAGLSFDIHCHDSSVAQAAAGPNSASSHSRKTLSAGRSRFCCRVHQIVGVRAAYGLWEGSDELSRCELCFDEKPGHDGKSLTVSIEVLRLSSQ
ncbi:MAG: hypothetical protein ABI885_18560 [Gammaproteobacteria bacterium]